MIIFTKTLDYCNLLRNFVFNAVRHGILVAPDVNPVNTP